jgi:hypothetical protein
LKRLLLNTYGKFTSEFKHLEEWSHNITSCLGWLNGHIPEEHWSALQDANKVRQNLMRIYKRMAKVPSRLQDIQAIFEPRRGTIKAIEDTN